MPGWEQLHPLEWRARALAAELFDLAQRGLLVRTDGEPISSVSDVNPSELWVSSTGCKIFHLMRLDEADEDLGAAILEELREVQKLPIPADLIGMLERSVDSEPLSDTDLSEGRVRIRLDEKTRALLPPSGTETVASLRGYDLEVAVRVEDSESGCAQLLCSARHVDDFQAILESEPGRILRVAPMPEGMLALD
jgi:hypothetical protein